MGLGLSSLRSSWGPQLDAQSGYWSSRVWPLGERRSGARRLEQLEPLRASGLGRQPSDLISIPGNIRVLCRLRPGTPSSLVSSEPGPGGTVTTCYRGHQRRFRLDWVFPPDASQEEVKLHLYTCVGLPQRPQESPGALVPFPALSPSQEQDWVDSSREGEGSGRRTGSRAGLHCSFQGFPSVSSPSSQALPKGNIWFRQEG